MIEQRGWSRRSRRWAAVGAFATIGAMSARAVEPIPTGGSLRFQPTAASHAVLPLDRVERVQMPRLDRDTLLIQDEERAAEGLPPRYAVPNVVVVKPATHGTWEEINDDTLLWRLRIHSPDAVSINLGFTRYHMPPGGRLLVYSAGRNEIIRPFTADDNEAHGQLWTPVVRAEEIVVELTIPVAQRDALALELGSINIGYREFGSGSVAASGSCNVDVICPEGDDWRDQIQSVGVISTGGSTFCTGFAVNNTAQDLTPYFMTANHCSITSGNAASLVVYWNYQNSVCRPAGSPASGGPGDGSLSQFQTGSFFRASYSPSDFTLVELDDDPNPAWNVVLSGWDRSSADADSAVGIHHPNTDEKRISFEFDPTTTTSYLGSSVPGDGTHVRITDWDIGTTEPGSSGSPVFNQDHRIIGQLHGGYAACGNDDSDWYGRFSRSWTGGGTSSSRLSNWLDPGSTGATAIDSVSTAGMSVSPSGDVLHIGDVGGPFTNPTVTYTLTNPTPNPIDYEASLTASFGILLDGGTAVASGTLAASGGTIDVVVTLGSDIDLLSAGVYVEDIVFSDLTTGVDYTRRHTVEVGQTLFSVVPETNLETGGPVGGPFPVTAVYTVTSERPSPITVRATASDSWISLNGASGPITLNLSGTGTSDTITVGLSSDASLLPPGLYSGTVLFRNLSGGTGDTSRSVILDVGRVRYSSTDTPQSITDNNTITSTIVVPDDFCIGDVNVDVDISHTYIGDLIVDLRSPDGTTVRLHNRTGGSDDDIDITYDDEGDAPDGPGALSDFDFLSAAGSWVLTVSDNASQDTGSLNSWALRIAPEPGDCPTPQVVHSFPLDTDPGWTMQGQWGFGTPTGGGSGPGDPTSGFTGSNVLGYNLSGDYPDNLSPIQYLTTKVIDCSDITHTRLQFRRWLGIESASFDHASIQVSNDNSSWSTVWSHSGGTMTESSWSFQSVDISGVADEQATVYIRWGMGTTDGSVTFAGWNIDDVEIQGVTSVASCDEVAEPDVCCRVASTAAAPNTVATGRYLSFVGGNAGRSTAVRVTLTDLPDPHDVANGQTYWVGPPQETCENPAQITPPVGGCEPAPGLDNDTFLAATLQCAPYYTDWSALGTVYVSHQAIVPDGRYGVQEVDEWCAPSASAAFSAPTALATSRWGDLVGDCSSGVCGPPDGSVDVTYDVLVLIDKFRSAPGAPPKSVCDLEPATPDRLIDITDAARCLDAFRGLDYPFAALWAPCP